jgi:hypothetical protein
MVQNRIIEVIAAEKLDSSSSKLKPAITKISIGWILRVEKLSKVCISRLIIPEI